MDVIRKSVPMFVRSKRFHAVRTGCSNARASAAFRSRAGKQAFQHSLQFEELLILSMRAIKHGRQMSHFVRQVFPASG